MRRIIKRNACGVACRLTVQPKNGCRRLAQIVSGVGVCENEKGEDL